VRATALFFPYTYDDEASYASFATSGTRGQRLSIQDTGGELHQQGHSNQRVRSRESLEGWEAGARPAFPLPSRDRASLAIPKTTRLIASVVKHLANGPDVSRTVAKIATTSGVRKLIIGEDGLLSAPAASNLVRKRNTAGAYLRNSDHTTENVERGQTLMT
jgi:hypothetical protein